MDNFKENVRDNAVCMVLEDVLQCPKEVRTVSEYNTNQFHRVYREISEKLGIEAALTIHQMFKGTQVNFPIKFFDNKSIKEMMVQEFDGDNVKMLAKKYGYSEKSVRRIIKDSVKKRKEV